MPELAEVDYYRKQWDPGIGRTVTAVATHADKRVFRGTDVASLQRLLPGKKLTGSESGGKQMLFRFGNKIWLGLHLGMTGKLFLAKADYQPEKHDHLVIYQKDRALVFNDLRQFGRVKFHHGADAPEWWSALAPAVASKEFSPGFMTEFLQRHPRLPIKAALLLQEGFAGVGNWMADEILWRAGISPHRVSSSLDKARLTRLYKEVRYVCRVALEKIGPDFSDPPTGWLFHERWKRAGHCPRHKSPLTRETIRGRTAAWCPRCQK
jgi:formamidopyrimidine-DNA glycosylase